MRNKKTLVFAFAIVVLMTGITMISAVTGSIGNGRMVLYPEVNGWTNTVIPKTILVNNVNSIPVNITLRLDSNASKFIELVDETFILEAGESKKAEITIKVKKEGTYEGRVNVFFKPVEGKEAGVVLSSTIIVIAKKDQGYKEKEEPKESQEETNPENSGEQTNPSKLVKIFGINTLILFVVLLILIYIWGKKRKKSKRKVRRK